LSAWQFRQCEGNEADGLQVRLAWAGLTLRRRARKSLTQQNTTDLDRSEDLDWTMDGADPWDFC